jgi:uncharacterized protein
MKRLLLSTTFLIVYLGNFPLTAQEKKDTLAYSRQEFMIPMRDGVKLYSVIFTPENVKEPLPLLFNRTPYGVSWITSPNQMDRTSELAQEGYIFVFQDIRGLNRSEGKFTLQHAMVMRDTNKPNDTDESTDAYDAIDWLIKNIPGNNGKVGMYGSSADARTTMMGTIESHPALKAASEHATPSDQFIGDDFHHNGAFRLSAGFENSFFLEYSNENTRFPFDKYDTYEWYLYLGPLSNVNEKYFHKEIPSWNDYILHPTYDDFWKKQSFVYMLKNQTVPILHIAGWWDQEDFYGPLKAYEVLEKNDRVNQNFIVIGPWNHGGWRYGKGDKLSKFNFGSPASEKFRKEIQAPFFAYYLKGKGTGEFPEATTFQTGSNIWKTYDKWPPIKNVQTRNLYLKPESKLSFDIPKESQVETFDEYLSDPKHPVPYRNRPIVYGSGWSTWLLEDQRFVHNRPDVESWATDTLSEDIEVTGSILADIFASTSGTDADWIVKLIDIYPEIYPEDPEMRGYQLMIASDVLRGRFRNSFSNPEPVKPDEINEYKIDLHAINHVFKKGHKIMVQIQSTWFPVFDRNPQKFVPNIFEAKETDFISAHQKIYRSLKYPSHIVLPVIEK